MSIRSMTGFGRAALSLEGVAHVIEIRAVNHRYLDLKLRLPRHLAALEPQLRKQIGAALKRGRVDVNITSGAGEAGVGVGIELNHALIKQLVAATTTSWTERPSADFFFNWPGVLQAVPAELEDANLAEAVLPAVAAATDAVVVMRQAEGAALAEDLRGHLAGIAVERDALLAEAPQQVEQYQARLRKRIDDLLDGRDFVVDEARLLHEVAVFAERSDIAEELSRLGSHIEQFEQQLAKTGPVGRRLDFLCQEMLREANTIASKVQDAGLSARAIEIKARLEQLREQAQNVE